MRKQPLKNAASDKVYGEWLIRVKPDQSRRL